MSMKKVKMVVRGSCYPLKSNWSKYTTTLEYRGCRRKLTGTKDSSTSNRIIIKGIIAGVRALKEPCEIELYTTTNVGFSALNRSIKSGRLVKGSINADLLEDLRQALLKGGHRLNYVE